PYELLPDVTGVVRNGRVDPRDRFLPIDSADLQHLPADGVRILRRSGPNVDAAFVAIEANGNAVVAGRRIRCGADTGMSVLHHRDDLQDARVNLVVVELRYIGVEL